MDANASHTDSSSLIWLAATLAAGETIYHKPAQPAPHEPGTLRQQLEIARLAADNPWIFADPDDALQAARRVILVHAKRRPR